MKLSGTGILILLAFLMNTENTQGHDDCRNYQVLNDRTRAASIPRGNVLRCDQRDIPHSKWYRFTGSSGNQMPTKVVPTNRCGTHAPGWLSSPHPTRIGQVVNGTVCFHWNGNRCRWSNNIQIKMCNGYYIYKLGRTPCCYLRYCGNAGFTSDPCSHYTQLSDRERAAGIHRGNILKCDKGGTFDSPKWYRFTGAAGSQMPTSCVSKDHCGTHAPGWLSGPHPTRVGEIVNAKVCFHWSSSCCNWDAIIQIKRCNGFYVYKLMKTPACSLRFCGNAGFDPCKTLKPCQNGATCVNNNGNYSCHCKPGYNGKNCEQVFDACKHFTTLSDKQRAAGVHRGNFLRCDQKDLAPNWYRFTGEAGTQMPTSCVPKQHCGTHAPGWLAGVHPKRVGEIVNGTVCFHWSTSCCKWNANIQIKRCNGFYVYNLVKTPECSLRYCGNKNFDPCKARTPCQNGGSCVNNNSDYTCICKPGYKGKNCEQDVDECITRPCFNGGTCQNLFGSYSCTCKPGFTGKRCENAIDGCVVHKVLREKNRAANYTGALANCDKSALKTPAWYRFSGSAGDKMADSCVKQSHCGTHAPGWLNGDLPLNAGQTVERTVCFHWSSSCCNWSVKIKVKKCSGNYFVYELQRPPVCHLRYCGNKGLAINECAILKPCKNGSTCYDLPIGYRCQCRIGFQGKNCDIDINECLTNNPCKNGSTCVNNIGGYQCLCVPGYTGLHCDQDVDECNPIGPCKNGGICVNKPGSYECQCLSGYQGNHCQSDINECFTNNPCKNGSTCVNNIGGYMCLCVPGTTGLHCHLDVDECNPIDPCKNGGICINKPGSYECQCLSGYQGNHCESDVDECSYNPCKNGGTCSNTVGNYSCACYIGFDGKNCEKDVDECKSTPCKNGATCVNVCGSFRCECTAAFTGRLCDKDIDECSANPCQNSGNCSNTVGDYTCKCIKGFEGKHCQNDTNECKPNNPCKNGGACQNLKGTYKCICVNNYTGFNCEIKKQFQPLGCFKDKGNDRAMDKLLKNLRKNIDWSDISKIIQMCSRIARGYSKPDMPNVRYFAIQYYGECWGGRADAHYDKHGRAPDDACWNGVGSANINFVYELL